MEYTFETTHRNRKLLHDLFEKLSIDQLNQIPEGFKNNIIWNIAHVIVTQQLLAYGLSNLPRNVSEEMIAAYRNGTKPEKDLSENEMNSIKGMLFNTNEQIKIDYDAGRFEEYKTYTTSTGHTLSNVEEALEYNNYHEGLHMGTIRAYLNLV
ncbi:MAG: DinB family protein [Leeuwenhoekiella sp.]